jgi:Lar family restriction alleviation protein
MDENDKSPFVYKAEGPIACPFCGDSAHVVGEENKYYFVQCEGCGVHQLYHRSEEKAVREWNNRVYLFHDRDNSGGSPSSDT